MRLVDGDQRRARRADGVDELGLGQLLGGEEQEADRSVPQRLEDLPLVAGGHAGAELRRPPGAVLDLGQPRDLVLLQGDQRGDDDHRPVEQLARTW